MKALSRNLAVFVLIAGAVPMATAQSHDHHAPAHKNSSVNSEAVGKKFKADNDLKSRMNTIVKTAKSLHGNGNDNASISKAGEKIENTVNDIFKTCKLEPKADAAIHPVLADLLNGAGQLKKGDLKRGQDIIHNALKKYESIFE